MAFIQFFAHEQRQNKSVRTNCVSRTRFRKAAERRKRRGRCTNLLMQSEATRCCQTGRKQQQLAKGMADLESDGMMTMLRCAFGVCILVVARDSDYLLIDISNSHAKFAFASKRRVSAPVRIATSKLSSGVVSGFLKQRKCGRWLSRRWCRQKPLRSIKAAKKRRT